MDIGSEYVESQMARLAPRRYAILLGALVLRLVTVPAVDGIIANGWFPAVVAAKALQSLLLIFACVLAVGRGRTLVVLALAAIAALILEGIDALWEGETIAEAGKAAFVGLLIVWATAHLLRRTFSAREICTSDLHAAAAIYLLLGFAFATAYQFLNLLQPHAFHLPEGTGAARDTFLYFSFVTLATVGYGDVTPVSGIARMLAVTEAVAGQIYLVVSVARLVGLHVAQRTPRRED
jgi:uncharacterized membrane protein